MYSGMVGKGSEVTHQQCGGRRPRPTPSHLPGQRRPSLRWSVWATMLTGHYNKEKKVHKYINMLDTLQGLAFGKQLLTCSMSVLFPTYLSHEGSQAVNEQIGLSVVHQSSLFQVCTYSMYTS